MNKNRGLIVDRTHPVLTSYKPVLQKKLLNVSILEIITRNKCWLSREDHLYPSDTLIGIGVLSTNKVGKIIKGKYFILYEKRSRLFVTKLPKVGCYHEEKNALRNSI